MKTALPPHYAGAIAVALATPPDRFREHYSPRLHLSARTAPTHRQDLQGKLYLEAFEKVPGGVVFLNWWAPATPAGVTDFFAGLATRTRLHVSPRPYRLGQACDGTIGSPVLHACKIACDALGLDADALYKKAYPERDDDPPDWADCQRHTDWQGGVVWPAAWDEAAVRGLAASLTEINFHRLVAEFSDAADAILARRAVAPAGISFPP